MGAPRLPAHSSNVHTTTNATPDVASLIRHIREARFSAGLACVRCQSSAVIRWGTFRGRQRFRCRACQRTFSDLTGTPVAYAKRLGVLPAYRDCMRHSLSVRASARAVGVHLTTSFRWRHRLLAGAFAEETVVLSGLIEVEECRVLCSDTRPYSPFRRRERRLVARRNDRPSWLVGMRDRTGRSVIGYAGEVRPNWSWWEFMVTEWVDAPALIITRTPARGPVARVAQANGIRVWSSARIRSRGASDLLCHTSGVASMLQRFRRWLRRFCGVSTKYLDNYATWYGMLDPLRRRDRGLGSVFAWPLRLQDCPNTFREQRQSGVGTG